MKRQAITRLTPVHSVRTCCRALGVSRSSYYESSHRQTARAQAEKPIVDAIKDVHRHRYKSAYGSPRMVEELRGRGHEISRHKTARLMREYQLKAKTRRRAVRTTDSKHSTPIAANVLARRFEVGEPKRAWCADITYLKTPTGWLYLAAILNVGTRKWVGYAVDTTMHSTLIDRALSMALCQETRLPTLMHTDRGSQYASAQHRAMLRRYGITLSMSRKGNCWDNAVIESFFGTFKEEAGDTFIDQEDARSVVFDYQAFYNRERRHSALANRSPIQFEMDLQREKS